MPFLIPLAAVAVGGLGLGGALGFTSSKGAQATAEVLKWATIGTLAIGGFIVWKKYIR